MWEDHVKNHLERENPSFPINKLSWAQILGSPTKGLDENKAIFNVFAPTAISLTYVRYPKDNQEKKSI